MNVPFSPLKRISGMTCDGFSLVIAGCPNPVLYGLRIHVPSKTQDAPGHAQARMSLTVHCCELHKGAFKLDDLLTDKLKAAIEEFGRRARPIDWKPDFDSAFLQYVDVYGAQYKNFLKVLEAGLNAAEDRWGGPIA
ncbi:MAG TPA: hypothetical protein VGG48_01860 [Rhizomicrobium sp.]|jgi:hypothetical protein